MTSAAITSGAFSSLQTAVVTMSVAYALLGALLLAALIRARFDWRLKAGAVVLTSAFYVIAFVASRNLLGWAAQEPLPPYFKLLQARIVEPHSSPGDPGSIYLWVEALGDDRRPSAAPRAYRLPFTERIANRAAKAAAELAAGRPQGGLSSDFGGGSSGEAEPVAPNAAQVGPENSGGDGSTGTNLAGGLGGGGVAFTPLLPPKMPAKD